VLLVMGLFVVLMPDKLSGLYLTISHAIKINSPATFEIVPIIKDSHAPAPTSDIHYLWLFGDEASPSFILFYFIYTIKLPVSNFVD